jgi:hypothetical protein
LYVKSWTQPSSHRPYSRHSRANPPASNHTGRLPPVAHPHPHAGGRGDGPRAAERADGIGRGVADFAHPEGVARRNRATGVQAACRIPVKWPLADAPE